MYNKELHESNEEAAYRTGNKTFSMCLSDRGLVSSMYAQLKISLKKAPIEKQRHKSKQSSQKMKYRCLRILF